jgi:GTP-binding protein
MDITNASYLISSPSIEACPPADRPEYAFIGRSNVGKSSVLNLLADREHLAKTSGSPGKTQLINHFEIESGAKGAKLKWYMVDLPGYGFAKVSQAQRKNWEKMIENYIRKRETLGVLFVLIDSRHGPQALDLEFIDKLGEWQVPFALVFTKSDKSTQKEVAANVRAFLNALAEHWDPLPPHFVTSAEKKTGRKALLDYIETCNDLYAGTTRRKPFP